MSYNFTEEIIEDKSDYNIDQLGLQVINLDASRAGWINHGTSESVIKRQKCFDVCKDIICKVVIIVPFHLVSEIPSRILVIN